VGGKEKGLKIAVASSSPKQWVEEHLIRLGLINYFDCITTIEATGKAKPDPELFNVTIEKLRVLPQEAIIFEDSSNGCKAAERAGIFCVAVLNQITKYLRFDNPNMVVESLDAISLEEIINIAEKCIPIDGGPNILR
jgi:beta-phosphoglucomutase-like phosphatase (HAD superfamily)